MTSPPGNPAGQAVPAATLEDLDAQVARMRENGELDDVGEGVLRRHFGQRAETLQRETQALAEEFAQRRERDGEAAATQWLSEAAEALGRRDGEETRRILSTVVNEA